MFSRVGVGEQLSSGGGETIKNAVAVVHYKGYEGVNGISEMEEDEVGNRHVLLQK